MPICTKSGYKTIHNFLFDQLLVPRRSTEATKFSQMIQIFVSVLYYVIILFPFDIRLDIMKPSLGSIVL